MNKRTEWEEERKYFENPINANLGMHINFRKNVHTMTLLRE